MNGYRSINIADDRRRTDVIDSYRPTRKSIQVIRAVMGNGHSAASHVVAPYGAGKSMAALAGIAILTGGKTEVKRLLDRIGGIDKEIAGEASRQKGSALLLLLHGACLDLGKTLAKQAGVQRSPSLRQVFVNIVRKARKENRQRIVIVWDEFGHHLETLVREGRPEDLLDVQNLAEWVVRGSDPKMSLTTLMHKGLNHYIRGVSETAESTWAKIEGRFETINLIDDGLDAIEMLSELLNRDKLRSGPIDVSRAREAGFFTEISDDARLADVLANSSPLTPAALQVLPRLSSQLAQAERTMVNFVREIVKKRDGGSPVGVDALYDYFAPIMRADTGPGGTQRRHVETESALTRTDTELEGKIVKTAALLQLGRSSERSKLPLEKLLYAVSEGAGISKRDVAASIGDLVDRKVLLHRRRVNDISVWHGSDLDIRQMINDEGARLALECDPAEELERLFPPDAYTAPRYNHTRAITRFAPACFIKMSDLHSENRMEALRDRANLEDALVALVFDATSDNIEVLQIARTLPSHFILGLPRRSSEIHSILADLMGIDSLLDKDYLLAEDPLVKRELLEYRSESEALLRKNLESIMNPDMGEVVWVSGLKVHDFSKEKNISGEILSGIFEKRFAKTPVIRNEQIVRRKITPVTRSACRRCMLAIIERTGLPELGYEGSTSADASIYRTVIERTGLYAKENGKWRWSNPDKIIDRNMRDVWSELKSFFAKPSQHPRNFAELEDFMAAPPIGLRWKGGG
ncbi:MAG: hypothetical protein OXE85_10275 [Roseovarius sp.]|nr:hypothetical protein [Roseovarius sp.]